MRNGLGSELKPVSWTMKEQEKGMRVLGMERTREPNNEIQEAERKKKKETGDQD